VASREVRMEMKRRFAVIAGFSKRFSGCL